MNALSWCVTFVLVYVDLLRYTASNWLAPHRLSLLGKLMKLWLVCGGDIAGKPFCSGSVRGCGHPKRIIPVKLASV